jgi:hypothetical protein
MWLSSLQRPALARNFRTIEVVISCVPLAAKYIAKDHFSPNKNPFHTVSYGDEIIVCKRPMVNRQHSFLGWGKDRFVQADRCSGKGGLTGIRNIDSDPSAIFLGWSDPEVFYRDNAFDEGSLFFLIAPWCAYQSDTPTIWKNIRSQLSSARADHYKESTDLQKGPDSNGARENQHPPIGRRFCLMILCILSGIFLALKAPDDGRILVRTSFIGGGMLLAGLGLGLWWLTGFPWTRGWWL